MRILSAHHEGLSFEWEGRTFTCIGAEPYTTRDGRNIILGKWDMECIVCQARFTGTVAGDFNRVAKRCAACKDAKRGPKKSAKAKARPSATSRSVGRGSRPDQLLRKF